MTIANDNENCTFDTEKFSNTTTFLNEHIEKIRNLADLGVYAYVKTNSVHRPISGFDVAKHFSITEKQAYASLHRLMDLGVISRRTK